MPKTVKLSTLKPNDRNPRTIQAAAFAKLCDSIKRDPQFMPLRPIVVDEAGTILGGNQRFRACQHLGMADVPADWVRVARDLTPEQRKRFVLLDNAPDGMAGDWDLDILAADYDVPALAALGFDRLLAELNPPPPPTLPELPGSGEQEKAVRLAVSISNGNKSRLVQLLSELGGSYVECTTHHCDVELRRLDTNAWALRRDKLNPQALPGRQDSPGNPVNPE